MRDQTDPAFNEAPAMARAASVRERRPILLTGRESEAVAAGGSKPGGGDDEGPWPIPKPKPK